MGKQHQRQSRKTVIVDGNTAAAHVAFAVSEVIPIYPISPSSVMGDVADLKRAGGEKNLWGVTPSVTVMQSEAGVAGAVHGALLAGSLATTFTASQGLLLMMPNMYKIAGELLPTVFHVSARSVATSALSIFCDHSDVMACRSTGWAMLCSNNVQETMDLALVASAATLRSRIPFLHFFDGFRTSHEIQRIQEVTPEIMRSIIDDHLVEAHRRRALTPDHPSIRGTTQNPDVFFQSRERANAFYAEAADIVQAEMDRFAERTGRAYGVVDYVGAADAENVVVILGSGADTVQETVKVLNRRGEKVGVVKVRLYRPFPGEALIRALPRTVRKIAVLDRTKEPGALGEPLCLDVQAAVSRAVAADRRRFDVPPAVVGGRYGLGSKEFTPVMAKAVFDNLKADRPKNGFVVGIHDDITGANLPPAPEDFRADLKDTYQAMFFGLSSDGTIGANKNSIKIIGDMTANHVQAYFVYDSKKAGSITTSHLRFGKQPIVAPYLIDDADFVACHHFSFLEKYNVLRKARDGATFLLCSPFGAEETWDHLPLEVQQQILKKRLKLYVVDAESLAEKLGLGPHINIIMQTAFFKISNIIPFAEAAAHIKAAIAESYGKAGDAVVARNCAAVDETPDRIARVRLPREASGKPRRPLVSLSAPPYVRNVLGAIMAGSGNSLPVSAMPEDGAFPTATAQYEKRNIAGHIPVWDERLCVQCGVCAFVCPHAAIRMKAYPDSALKDAPVSFKSAASKIPEFREMRVTIAVAPEDCTGCGACVSNCPAKDKAAPDRRALAMAPQPPLRESKAENFAYFMTLPDIDPGRLKLDTLRGSQLARPLFEYSGACAGCGQTPYVKLLSQLFGDHAVLANATGCSSVYGGNLPTTPWAQRADGRGPAWANSLFEDNAEFGLGMRLALDKFSQSARVRLEEVLASKDDACRKAVPLLQGIRDADQSSQAGIEAQRDRISLLREMLRDSADPAAASLLSLADYLVRKSVWCIGGDGWAYDIGYGGLDHILASGENVNVLVLDSEAYSNTGGQVSKATPLGAVAQFAADGKRNAKKDLGLLAMAYRHVYVASVSLANPAQTVKAFMEAEAYSGPSLIIAYAHCIAHGIPMANGVEQQRKAVAAGHHVLYRYNPDLAAQGANPFHMDSKAPTLPFEEYVRTENRWNILAKANPDEARKLVERSQDHARQRFDLHWSWHSRRVGASFSDDLISVLGGVAKKRAGDVDGARGQVHDDFGQGDY